MNKKNIDKSYILKTFNTQLKLFLKEIIEFFPKKDDIKSLNKIVITFCKFNPVKIIEIWFYYISTPYLSMIQKGDFNYFENKNYKNDMKDLNDNSKYVLESYDSMRVSISELDNNKKLKAMKNIQILTKLSNLYFN